MRDHDRAVIRAAALVGHVDELRGQVLDRNCRPAQHLLDGLFLDVSGQAVAGHQQEIAALQRQFGS